MRPINARLRSLADSPTLAVATRAQQLRAEGADVISLALGEPDFPTPPHIVAAAEAALAAGQTRYTPTAGVPALRAAVAARARAEDGVPAETSRVVVTAGAKQALYELFQVLLEPGDEVLVPAPYWVSYPAQIALAGGVMVPISTQASDGFRIDPEAVRAAVGPRTRAILLNSPCNPTGACIGRAELEAVAELVVEHDLDLISDEVYQDLVYEGPPPVSPASLGPEVAVRTHTVDAVSKAYSMTGWRLGWFIAGRLEVAAAVTRLQSHATSNASSISQAAALAALTQPRTFQGAWLREFDRRRLEVVRGLDAIPGLRCTRPTGAFYAFPDVREHLGPKRAATDDAGLALALLEGAGVATVPGSAFGAPGHLRLSYAIGLERLQEALGRMADYLALG